MNKAIKPYKVDYIGDNRYAIVERPTSLVIGEYNDARVAKPIANFLNGGNGFNGYTPSFFLKRWIINAST